MSYVAKSASNVGKLPKEIWWKILLETTVAETLSGARLKQAITMHGPVCRTWLNIVREPVFAKQAKALLYATDPRRRYLPTCETVRYRGLGDHSTIGAMTVIGKKIYVLRKGDANAVETYDSEKGRYTLVFHLVNSAKLSSVQLDNPQAMVGCGRLLVLLDWRTSGEEDAVYAFDPETGRVRAAWVTDCGVLSLNSAGKDQLVLTLSERLQVRDLSGNVLHDMSTTRPWTARESMLMPDKSRFLVCLDRKGGRSRKGDQLVTLSPDKAATTLFTAKGRALGFTVDSHGYVLLFLRHCGHTKLQLLGPTGSARYLTCEGYLCNWSASGAGNERRELWLDEDRGLLFHRTRHHGLSVYHILDESD